MPLATAVSQAGSRCGLSLGCGRQIDVTEKLATLTEHRSAAAGNGSGCDFAARQRQGLQRNVQAAHRLDAVSLRLPSDNEFLQHRLKTHSLELRMQRENMLSGDRRC